MTEKKKRDIVYTTESGLKTTSQHIETVIHDIKNPFNEKDYKFSLIDSNYILSLCTDMQ